MYEIPIKRKRIWSVFILFALLISILYYRVVKLQYIDSKKYSALAEAQYSYRENTESLNFKLLDRNGTDLSNYKKKYYAVVVPLAFKSKLNTDSEAILNLTYALRNYDRSYDLSNMEAVKNNPKLYWEIDEETYNIVKKIKSVQGIYAYELNEITKKGAWNVETLLINSRRSVDNSFKDKESIEIQIYNKIKANKYKQVIFERDVSGNITSESISEPENNINVRLTIDKAIQEKMSMVLGSEKYKKYKQAGAVLMESDTGKILGMVQKDDSNPNVNIGAATENGFYPGSIFKVIVEEAALKNNALKLTDKFTCRSYYEDAHKNHGTLTSHEAMVVSCNDIYAQIGNKAGYKAFYDMAEKQGLFSKVIGFDSELAGKFEISQPKLSDGSISIASMGQGMRMTPLEALSISNTVINQGVYVKPYLLDAYVDKNNNAKETFSVSKSALFGKEIAKEIKNQMIEVVKSGTAKGTEIYGIEIGGKTGTTERGNYSDGWFAGFFSVNNKNYSMIVFVENIDKFSESGGDTAAPVFKDIVNETKNILK